MMTAQTEVVYDYMIERGLKLHKPTATKQERRQVNSDIFGKIYYDLSTKRGALSRFAERLVNDGLFTNVRTALQALRYYGTNSGTTKTNDKREDILKVYVKWNGKTYVKDVEKWNRKLQNYWSEHGVQNVSERV